MVFQNLSSGLFRNGPYSGVKMGTKKGGARKGKPAGSRKAYDDTKDSKKRPSASASRKKGVTTKKGMARKGTVAGSRLAYDDTEKIRTDQNLKKVKTKVRKGKIGKGTRTGMGEQKYAKVPKRDVKEGYVNWMGNFFERDSETASQEERIDEGILRLIRTHHKSDNVIQAIERLILGKYK